MFYLFAAVEALESCCNGSLSNLSQYKHKSACRRAIEDIDTCVAVHQAVAEQRAGYAERQERPYPE
jgi:hypothetical protein